MQTGGSAAGGKALTADETRPRERDGSHASCEGVSEERILCQGRKHRESRGGGEVNNGSRRAMVGRG